MRRPTLVTLAAITLLAAPSAGAAAELPEVKSLLQSIDESMFPAVGVASMKMTSFKRVAPQKELAMEFTVSADNALIKFTAPAIDKGKYILKSGKNLWMFFSDIKRSIRLSARDSFMGTDANNYDILQMNLLGDYDTTGHSAATLDGRSVLKVELSAKKGTEGYHKITSWIDPQERRLIQNDCYSNSGTLIKSIRYEATREMGRYRVPTSVLIVNHVIKDQTTRIDILRVEPRPEIRASLFTLGYLDSLD
jgi:hypothetical protein